MKNKKNIYSILLLLLLASCAKKEIQLPIIEIDGIHEIQNHSSIWIFFEISKQDTLAVLNKNNKLLNTDWIFNIDKRLPMHKIVPLLQKMQENRNKDSMHKKEGMLNYFSYSDIASNNISLVNYKPITFITSKKEYQIVLEKLTQTQVLELEIQNNKLLLNQSEIKDNQLIKKINTLHTASSFTTSKIILKYNENITFQDYLNVKALLSQTEVEVDNTEFIFSIK